MYSQGHLTLRLKRVWYHFRNMRFFAFFPIVVVNVLLQWLLFFNYSAGDADENFYVKLVSNTQMAIPFFSVWWIILTLKIYTETGNEVLYICRDKNKLLDMLGLLSIYLADIAIIYALYSQIFPNIWLELIKQVCVITFLFGLVYFVAFLTSSVTFTFMAVVMYVLANLVIPLNNPIFPFYLNYQVLNTTLAWKIYIPLFGAGLVLTGFGVWLNMKKLKLN